MKVRYKNNPSSWGYSDIFNTHSMDEVIVYFPEGDATSEYISELECLLENPLPSSAYKSNVWISMSEAFRSRVLISDNYNRYFREPRSEAEKERGWYD